MTYTQVAARFSDAAGVFCKPGTERVEALCARLSHPESAYPIIHVTGTNGKGSTSAMIESVLRASGYRTGLFSTPYLGKRNGCIRIDGIPVDDTRFTALSEKVFSAADGMADPPTEYELLTALAFLAFAEEKVDVAVIEVCMGGRLDATNVIDAPLLSVITGISLEHTAYLGNTLAEIAHVKAGIIKAGSPILYGGTSGEAEDVIRKEADTLGAPFYKVDPSRIQTESANLDGTRFTFDGIPLSLPILGLYQTKNAACALSALALLKKKLPRINEDSTRKGLASLRWEARFERLSDDPPIFFDGAHNPEGIAAVCETLKAYFPDGICLVGGILKDKDHVAVAKLLSPFVRQAFTVTPPSPRALSADGYRDTLLRADIRAESTESVDDALTRAIAYAKENGLPVVCLGSLYLYDSIKTALKKA